MIAGISPTLGKWSPSEMEMDPSDWAKLNAGRIHVVLRGMDVIAAVWCGDDRDGEEASNARLIAAAPTMARALLDLRRLVPSGSEAMAEIDQALGVAGIEPWRARI